MAGLNISKFKKVAEDEVKSVLEHPEHGHQITIIHAKLSPQMMQELQKMPVHRAKGGGFTEPGSPLVSEAVVHGVDENPAEGQYLPCLNTACKSFGKSHPNCGCYGAAYKEEHSYHGGGRRMAEGGQVGHFCQKSLAHDPSCEYYKPVQKFAEGEMAQPAEAAPAPAATPEPAAPAQSDLSKLIDTQHKLVSAHAANNPMPEQPAPVVSPINTNKNIPAQFGQSVEAQNKALAAQVPAEVAAQQEIAQGTGAATDKMNQQLDQSWQIKNDLHKKFEDTAANIAQNPYDISLWHNRSTPMKILAGIGMLFGGAGVGIAGHPELASQAIQNAVNNDLEQQKAEHAAKNNLMTQYTNQYNNATAGEAATRLNMHAAVEGLIQRAAATRGAANAGPAAQYALEQNRQNALEKGIVPLSTQIMQLQNLGGPNLGNAPGAGGPQGGSYAPAAGAPVPSTTPAPEKIQEPQAAVEDPYSPDKMMAAAGALGLNSPADIQKPENLKKLKSELDNPSTSKVVNWKDKPEPELDMSRIAALAHDQPELAAEARKYSILQSQLNLYRHNYDLAVKHRNRTSNLLGYAPAIGAGAGAVGAGALALGTEGIGLPLAGGLIGGGAAAGNMVREAVLHGNRSPDVRGYEAARGALKSDIGRVLGDGSPTQTGINLEPLAPKYGDKDSTLKENREIGERAIRSIYGDFPLLKGRGLLPKNYNTK